jgi:hypothetical protein
MRDLRVLLLPLVALAALPCAPVSAAGQDTESRLSIHGYLTEAYAKSDGLPIQGITKDGTWDYYVAALQMRYAITDDDHLVLQVRGRRVGNSLLSDNDIALDWAYYSHNFGPVTAKVGKIPLPLGLYNEIRSVGTVLPFFRAPASIYREGAETIIGVLVSNRLPLGRWSLESAAYAGNIDVTVPEFTPAGPFLFSSSVSGNYGANVWLNTPITGVRVGASALHFRLPSAVGDTVANTSYTGSLDATFDRFFVRGEYQELLLTKVLVGGGNETQHIVYGQGGVKLTDHVSLNVQVEVANNNEPGRSYLNNDDRAIGVNYAVSPNIVFKIEGHTVRGYAFDMYLPTTGPAQKSNYGIASVSVSF